MHDGVSNEACAPPEGLPTLRALIGLLSTVNPLVAAEVRPAAEGLPTLRALVGLLFAVGGEMPAEA